MRAASALRAAAVPACAASLAAARREARCEGSPAPTLREWLDRGPYAVTWSQGFGCEVASLGATLALCDAAGGEANFRASLVAVSGASSGAKIAALVATPTASLEAFGAAATRVRFRDVLLDARDTALSRGGLCGGSALRRLLERHVGASATIGDLALPFGCSAFDAVSLEPINLTAGGVVECCLASGAFPLLFPPVTVGGRLLTDAAFFTDASGARALPGTPRRVLQIAHADFPFNGPWVVERPSTLGGADVASLVVTGAARVLPLPPGAMPRTKAALDGARAAVRDCLDAPMRRGAETGHYLALAVAPRVPETDAIDRANRRTRLGLAVCAAALVALARPRR